MLGFVAKKVISPFPDAGIPIAVFEFCQSYPTAALLFINVDVKSTNELVLLQKVKFGIGSTVGVGFI